MISMKQNLLSIALVLGISAPSMFAEGGKEMANGGGGEFVTEVSLYSLLASPVLRDGAHIQTEGVLCNESLSFYIYPNRDDFLQQRLHNCIDLKIGPKVTIEKWGRKESLNGRNVSVKGVFYSQEARADKERKAHNRDMLVIGGSPIGEIVVSAIYVIPGFYQESDRPPGTKNPNEDDKRDVCGDSHSSISPTPGPMAPLTNSPAADATTNGKR